MHAFWEYVLDDSKIAAGHESVKGGSVDGAGSHQPVSWQAGQIAFVHGKGTMKLT